MLQRVTKVFSLLLNGNTLPNSMSEIKIIRKPRYDGRIKKRPWEDRRTDKGEGLGSLTNKKIKKDETEVTDELIEKIKRRKFAILLGYSGFGYYGMQRNPKMKTIEEELFKALLKHDYINRTMFEQVQTMQFQRAARTDKNVSAVRQVVSLKLPENVDIEKLNNDLPEAIRIFGIRRVTKGFNSKVQCDSRTYCYLMPTVAFVPAQEIMQQKGYRISENIIEKVNKVLVRYEGTKNFHNFTSKKKPLDPSAKRYIKSFTSESPFVKDDVEFTILKVRGQSFMLHQIRKMIGLVIAIVKGYTEEKTLDLALTNEKVNIPRAPGLGLILDYVHYERYNNRYGEDGVHEKLTWEECDEEIKRFKEKYIYPTIINSEIEEESMVNWIIRRLSTHTFDDSECKDNDDEDEKSDDEREEIKQDENKSEEKIERVALNS